jgi:hypothetical protein
LVDKLEHFVPLVEQGIEQAVRRVLREEQVPAAEKVLSLFEEHTMIITRRKEAGIELASAGYHKRSRG